jgi:phosphate transport system permease protein
MSLHPAVEGPGPANRPRLTSGSLPASGPGAIAILALLIAIGLIVVTDVAPALLLVGAAIVAGVVIYTWSRAVENRRKATDRAATFAVTSAFLLAVAPLVSVLWTVITRGTNRFDTEFFTETARNVVGAGGGAYHAIIGTLIITAVPIGIMAGIYINEYGRGRLKRALTFFVDVMTGIPSIVAGLFAYALFALILGPGVRLGVMGSIALAVLMIPIVVRATEEMLKIVPNSLREAAYALGVPKWRTVVKVVVRTALPGIITGVMLAIARIIGETAPLLITTGVVASTNWNPFDGRMQNLPVFSYNEYKNPGAIAEPYLERAWAAALVLIIIVMALNLVGRIIYRRFGTDLR